MQCQINTIEELKSYFVDNNINNSNDLSNKGLNYWNNELKPIINPLLFKKPNNKKELQKLIKENFPLLLIDIVNITDFKELFKNKIHYNNLKSIEYWNNPLNYLGYWNTSNITDISFCFSGQHFFNQKLYWNTKNVTNASRLFYKCKNLNQEIQLDLASCKNISSGFFYCHKLNSKIKLNNLDNVEDASSLFYGCHDLNQKIELNLLQCKDISNMFNDCYNINQKIELKNLNNIENTKNIFLFCSKLKFKNIKTIVNQLILKFSNINKLEKEIFYKIPEEYAEKIQNKLIGIINQI